MDQDRKTVASAFRIESEPANDLLPHLIERYI